VFEYALIMVFPAAMAFAAMMDLFTMTIPNRISLVLVGAFFVVAPLTGMSLADFGTHVGTGFTVLIIGILMFSFGLLGGGDAKLLAAASLWIGYHDLLTYIVMVALMGGGLALAILAYRGIVPPLWATRHAWAMRLYDKSTGIPYGIALSGAALWIFPTTAWFSAVAAG
jgi:prepilin peptidase CpaA